MARDTEDRCRQSRCRDQIPMKWTERERRLPNAGNCQEEKARWHPAEWKKGTESKDSITGKFYEEIRWKGTKNADTGKFLRKIMRFLCIFLIYTSNMHKKRLKSRFL